MNFKSIFLPVPENDYTPHLLQKAAVVMMSLLVLLSFATVNIQALLWQSSDWLVGTVLPAVVVDLTNSERQSLSEAPLVRNSLLDEAARLKAEDMATNGYFSHYSPTGVSPWYWFDEVSYVYANAGENLAIHFKDSGAVVEAWMNSPAHRANIVNGKYTEIGVGTAKGKYDGADTVFVVQLFGTPGKLPALVAITPNPVAPAIAPEPVVAELVPVPEEVDLASVDKSLVAGEQIVTSVNEVNPEVVAPEAAVETSEVIVEPIEVSEVVTDDNQVSIFSTHFATTTGLEPVAVGSVSGTTASQRVSFVGSLATRPSVLLQSVYLVIGLLVAILLLLSIIIGIHHTRPLQVVYGVAMLLMMSGLFYVHISLTNSAVIAAEPEVQNSFNT